MSRSVESAVGGKRPQHVAVVGAGMVGLSTAWFLAERGVRVTVLEAKQIAAGASWGNAGYLTPSLTTPLPEPSVIRYGVRAMVSPSSPVYVPLTANPQLLRFLLGFLRNSTARRWGKAMRAYLPVNRRALEAFDTMLEAGVQAQVHDTEPLLACFSDDTAREELVHEFALFREMGQQVDYELLTGDQARQAEPALSERTGAAIRVHGQRYINPPQFVEALAEAVQQRDVDIRQGVAVTALHDVGERGVVVVTSEHEPLRFDAVVAANGAHLTDLAKRFGVRQPVQAGRGYSFSVPAEQVPGGPLYFPAHRVACTPLGDRLRVAGMMEFRKPDAPLDQRRVDAIVDAVRPLFTGVDLDDRKDPWVGSRPVTPDGLPLIGATDSPRVFAAGGHGMWGIVLGPLTGQLLAERITTGLTPPELTPFDPLR